MKTEEIKKAQHIVVCRLGTPQCLWLLSSFATFLVGFFTLFFPLQNLLAHPGSHDALAAINEKLLVEPNSIEFLSDRAQLFANGGHFAEAQADVDLIMARNGGSVSVETLQVRLFRHRGEFAEAVTLLKRLIEAKNPEYRHISLLIEVYMDMQNWDDAEGLYRRCMDAKILIRPEQALSLLSRFRNDASTGGQRAHILLDKTIESSGNLPLFIETKAVWLVEDNRPSDAVVLLEQLYRRFPANLNFALRYGQLLEGLGHDGIAYAIYEASLARYERLPESRKSAPARLEAVAHLRSGLERTKKDVK